MEAGKSLLDSYELKVNEIIVDVSIVSDANEPVPIYNISITNISETTKIILEKIREEFISQETGALEEEGIVETAAIQEQFKKNIGLVKVFRRDYPHYLKALLFGYVRYFTYAIYKVLPSRFLKHSVLRVYKNI